MAVVYPIVCLFIISNKKMISYVQAPGNPFKACFSASCH
ncbi:Hypothetical protein ACI5QL_03263 [Bacillus velezensis]